MNSVLKNTLIFATGAAIGSLVAWKLLKKKYEQLAQDEIDSVKEVFSRLESQVTDDTANTGDTEEVEENTSDSPNLSSYSEVITDNGYTNYSNLNGREKEETQDSMDRPYVIDPDHFGEFIDYDTVSLTYYSDGILTDEDDEIIEDVDDIVGIESLTHFGEYEDDSVFVRNDRRECDYEILRDNRKYSDVMNKFPYRAEG
jgi:hypothetical protein